MEVASFSEALQFGDKISTKVILESSFSKEIRILLKEGQIMKEHKTKFPIVVQVLEGEIDFGAEGEIHNFKSGGIVALEGNIPHDLTAKKDSVIRLSLSKLDQVERVVNVVKESNK
ncbi:cupin [uncultured Cyclobacterium sp.]|uniref:cupin n=1 Tax=uncultured Cyclobacterium sp. TaxID=453820 RepID=UPI0030EE8392|tara:strand:- start:1007 stop:1354 length:348 start_codon:yes stop_codon:yes gene_type:complete